MRKAADSIGVGPKVVASSRWLLPAGLLAATLGATALIVDFHDGWVRMGLASRDAVEPLAETPAPGRPQVSAAEDSRYRAISEFVARKYRVSQERAYEFVHLAHSVGHQLGLDPLLIIAVIAVESRFNPIAESLAGAKGLMQIIPRYHTDKFEEYGGEKAVFDPIANVKVGARILKEYIRVTGNVGIALQMYAGALGDGEDHYTNKVMTEQQRLKRAASNPQSAD